MVKKCMCYIKMCKYIFGSVVLLKVRKMEEQLKRLVEHAEPKPIHLIVMSGKQSRLKTTFNPPLVFPSRYEMALCRLETYYSFPNIDATNNTVKVSKDAGKIGSLSIYLLDVMKLKLLIM